MGTANSRIATSDSPAEYWENRARKFASDDLGLKAVCSYGMPLFYNHAIHLTQRQVLLPWIKKTRGKSVLDLGCGVGRWSRLMAAEGASVTALDLSPTMIAEATKRARDEAVADNCRFLIGDLAALGNGGSYDFIFVVTVLQHILDLERLHLAVQGLKSHLAPEGRIVLLEAAPTRSDSHCDTAVFQARSEAFYVNLFAQNGLTVYSVSGVDPMPLKTWLLPHYQKLPTLLQFFGLSLATGFSLPIDLLLGKYLARRSWHKFFILEHSNRNPASGNQHKPG